MCAALIALSFPATAGAAIFTVNSTTDADDTDGGGDVFCDTDLGTAGLQCSLRAAVETADGQSGNDVVELPFDVTLRHGTPMQVNSGDGLTIVGTNPSARSVIDANQTSTHFDISEIDTTLQHVRLTGGLNTSGLGGSVSFSSSTGKALHLDDARVDGNASAPTGVGPIGIGGAIFALGPGSILDVVDSTIDGNTAGDATHRGLGGAIFLEGEGPSASFANTTISGNRAFGSSSITRGGAILAQNDASTPPNGTVTLTDSTVDSNRVGGAAATGFSSGGAIALTGTDTSPGLTVTGGSLSNNVAGGGSGNAQGLGGAVDSLGGAPISLTDVTVNGNRAGGDDGLAPGTGTGIGGAINASTSLTVTGSSFGSNLAGVTPTGDATASGGAIHTEGLGTTSITNSSFDGNRAGSGNGAGGASGGAIDASSRGPLTVTGSALTNNAAVGPGGGLYRFRDATSGPDDTISATRFTGNAATFDGGGLDVFTNVVFSISASEIVGNSAGDAGNGGGGIAVQNATVPGSGALAVSNSTITGNTANSATILPKNGGGLMAGSFGPIDVDISYSTISGNQAADQGGNVWVTGTTTVHPTVSFASSIISGGTATDAPTSSNCFFSSSPSQVDVASTGGNIEDTTPSQCGMGTPPTLATDLIGINPLLGSPASNGGPTRTVALLTGSPAIDHGVSPCPTTDQRGYPRPGLGSSACDSGAYELSVCNGAAVNQASPPTGCPPPVTGGGPPGATPPPPPAVTKKKCKKKKHRSAAAAKKCKKKKKR